MDESASNTVDPGHASGRVGPDACRDSERIGHNIGHGARRDAAILGDDRAAHLDPARQHDTPSLHNRTGQHVTPSHHDKPGHHDKASHEDTASQHDKAAHHDTVPGPGRLFGVSLGPGDPGLMTRAAWDALSRRDTVWVYPVRSGKTPSYALDIALRAGIEPVDEHRALVFPMTHDADKLARAWMNGAQTVLPWLQAGRDVMFLVEGDASTYATFGHLARTVRSLDARIRTPVLSGVNAFTAACAAVGEAVAEQDDTVAVVPAAYGVTVLDRLLPDFDTLVLMKIKPLIDELLDWLVARELLDRAHFIERVGALDERTLSGPDLLQLRGTKVNYLSLMVIKSHHRVRGERIRGCLKKSPASTASSTSIASAATSATVADVDAPVPADD